MRGKRTRSELERYMDGMVLQLRVHKAKRPEEWVRWASGPALWYGVYIQSYSFMTGVVLVSGFAGYALFKRRLGGGTAGELVAKSLPESAIEHTRRRLRKGTYDAEVGLEARAILESCATLAFASVAEAGRAHLANEGRPIVLETFRPLSKSLDCLMKAALARTQEATMMRRLPDEEALADLRAIEGSLAGLRDEAQRLAREFRGPSALPDEIALAAERLEARKELDQEA